MWPRTISKTSVPLTSAWSHCAFVYCGNNDPTGNNVCLFFFSVFRTFICLLLAPTNIQLLYISLKSCIDNEYRSSVLPTDFTAKSYQRYFVIFRIVNCLLPIFHPNVEEITVMITVKLYVYFRAEIPCNQWIHKIERSSHRFIRISSEIAVGTLWCCVFRTTTHYICRNEWHREKGFRNVTENRTRDELEMRSRSGTGKNGVRYKTNLLFLFFHMLWMWTIFKNWAEVYWCLLVLFITCGLHVKNSN
jgi:hypothetical protein